MVHIWNKTKDVTIIPHKEKEMNDYSLTKILKQTSDSDSAANTGSSIPRVD
jgi:predicted RNA binding protein YcfA (HicA-like mRNA interferase family)